MRSKRCGTNLMRPSRTASMAGRASGSARTNHCSESSGSTMVPERWQWPMACVYGSIFSMSPRASRSATTRSRASKRSRPAYWPAASFMRASRPMTVIDRQVVALADLEVDRVVAGRHLQRAGAALDAHRLVGDHRHRPVRGGHEHLPPDQVAVAVVLGVHGDGGVGRDRLRPRGGDDDVLRCRRARVIERPGSARTRRSRARRRAPPRGRRARCRSRGTS